MTELPESLARWISGGRMLNIKAKAKRWGTALGVTLMLAQGAQAETLSDALVDAFNHSGLLEQNRALLRAADEDVAIAMAALRPIVNFTGSLGRSFSRTTSTSLGTLSGIASKQCAPDHTRATRRAGSL